MYKKFSSHLQLAHNYWKGFLKKDDIVVDATCGNGHDSLFLLKLVENGMLHGFDIQKKAIDNTSTLLKKIFENFILYNDSHEDFNKHLTMRVNLFVYNLGYLPNEDKNITTKTQTTIKSISSALSLLDNRGAISITCYPHLEGQKEKIQILDLLKNLDPNIWNICHHQWINRKLAPSLFWIEKRI